MPIEPGGKNPDPTDPSGKNPGGLIPDPTDTEAPAGVSGATFGDLNVIVWANPTDADFSGVLILRNTVSIADVPSAGVEYTVGGDIGSSEVVQSANSSDFGVSATTAGTAYYYKIFAYDASHNYAAGVEIEATRESSDKTIFVNAAASGTGDGTSWSNAYSSLNLALTSSAGTNKIVVAKGIYKPTPTSSTPGRNATFQLKSNVKVYGGFDVADTLLSERNWLVNKTILSGDIDNNDTVNADGVTETTNRVMTGSTTVTSDIKGNNVYTVVTGASNTTLEGFTITAGLSNGSSSSAAAGGGLYNDGGSSANVTLSNIIFSGNLADSGGGMYNSGGMNMTLSNVIFSGNTASNHGSGLLGGGGFSNNGGEDLILSNVIFSGNKSKIVGGGMRNGGEDVTLSNVTFLGNKSDSAGGGLFNGGAGLKLSNVIFSDNMSSDCPVGTTKGNMNFCNSSSTGTVTISHSLIQGCSTDTNWWASTHANSCASGNTGNNIDADPLFADADGVDNVFGTLDDDLSLMMGSPAIDAGSNGSSGTPLFPAGALDLAGKPRIVKGKSASAGPLIDMGAYEFQPMPPL